MLATVVATFLLLLALNAASGAADYQRFTVRVVWPGGTNCSAPLSAACNDTGLTSWPEGWAASDPSQGGGDWSGGSKSFSNPLPANMRIGWVEVDLYGRFECSPNETHTAFDVQVQKEAIASLEFQANASKCQGCRNCGYLHKATSRHYGTAGLPDYDYGPQAPNILSLQLHSGLLVLNAADIHIYAKDSTGGSNIDMSRWEFIAILISALIGVVILVSTICFGIILFLKSRGRLRRSRYTEIPGKAARGSKGEGTSGRDSTYDDDDDGDCESKPPTRDTINNLTGSDELLVTTENTALLSNTPTGNLGNPAKAKEVLGAERGHHHGRPRKRSAAGQNWKKQIQVTEIKILGRIGRGSYGDVFKGVWQGTVVAVKKLPGYFIELREEESAAFLDNFQKEASIMKSLHHPNILQLLSTYMEPPDLCLVMEYMPKGSLYKILHDQTVQLDWPIVRKILLDAAKGMAYLHGCEPVVIHRDLKSHNLLIDNNWTCKVCDFGLSKILTDRPTTSQMTSCGTPSWTAPEVLRNDRYTEKADVFGFGVVVWECVTRQDPHPGMPPFQVVLEVGSKHLRPEIPSTAPTPLQDLMRSCWSEDPAQRPSFQEIVRLLISMKVHALYPPAAAGDGVEADIVREGSEDEQHHHQRSVTDDGTGEDEGPVRPVMLYSPSAELRAPHEEAISSSS